MAWRADNRSEAAKRYRPWYRTAEWAKIRSKRLRDEPTCRICDRQRAFDPMFRPDPSWTLVVDHVKPHKGDERLFFSYENTMTLCTHHHNSTKKAIEARGNIPRTGIDGWPIED